MSILHFWPLSGSQHILYYSKFKLIATAHPFPTKLSSLSYFSLPSLLTLPRLPADSVLGEFCSQVLWHLGTFSHFFDFSAKFGGFGEWRWSLSKDSSVSTLAPARHHAGPRRASGTRVNGGIFRFRRQSSLPGRPP